MDKEQKKDETELFTIKKLLENMIKFAEERGVELLCFEYKGKEFQGHDHISDGMATERVEPFAANNNGLKEYNDEAISEMIKKGENFKCLQDCSDQSKLSFILGAKLFKHEINQEKGSKIKPIIYYFSKRGTYTGRSDTSTWGNVDKVIKAIIENNYKNIRTRSVTKILGAIFAAKSSKKIAAAAENFANDKINSDPMKTVDDETLLRWVVDQGKNANLISLEHDQIGNLSRKEIYMLLWYIAFYLLENVSLNANNFYEQFRNSIKKINESREEYLKALNDCINKLLSRVEDGEAGKHNKQTSDSVVSSGGARLVKKTIKRVRSFSIPKEYMEALKISQTKDEFVGVVFTLMGDIGQQGFTIDDVIKLLSSTIVRTNEETLKRLVEKDPSIIALMYCAAIILYCRLSRVFEPSLFSEILKSNIEEIRTAIGDTDTSI